MIGTQLRMALIKRVIGFYAPAGRSVMLALETQTVIR
jgi:hypothetical protein